MQLKRSTKGVQSRCACGRVKSKMSSNCRQCHREHMDQIHAATQIIVDTGKCPLCGSPLARNNAMSGWWQCSKYSTVCGWQGFTE